MGTKKIDREDKPRLKEWEERKKYLRSLIVDTRTLTRDRLDDFQTGYLELDPVILFPREEWKTLYFSEKRWLEVEAATRSSRGAILVGRSAARWYGMWVVSRTKETIEITLPSGGNSPSRRNNGGYMFRYSELLEDELLEYQGQLSTTPIRTFIDIARYHGFAEGLIAADYLLRRGKTREEISTAIRRMGRARGIATARRCLEHAIANSGSQYESLARALLIDANVGTITAQHHVNGRYADLCIDGWLLIEIDGDVKYRGPGGEQALIDEAKREKAIRNQGYVFLRYPPEFIRDKPHEFLSQVRETLAGRDLLLERIAALPAPLPR